MRSMTPSILSSALALSLTFSSYAQEGEHGVPDAPSEANTQPHLISKKMDYNAQTQDLELQLKLNRGKLVKTIKNHDGKYITAGLEGLAYEDIANCPTLELQGHQFSVLSDIVDMFFSGKIDLKLTGISAEDAEAIKEENCLSVETVLVQNQLD